MSYSPRHAKPSPTKRRVQSVAAAAGVSAALIAAPSVPAANAEPAPNPMAQFMPAPAAGGFDGFVAQANASFQNLAQNQNRAARDAAWNMRLSLHQQADALAAVNPDLPAQARAAVDQAVEAFFPGIIAEHTPAPAPAPAPAPEAAPVEAPAPQPAAFDYGPCPREARACVDLDGRRSWLQNDGQEYYASGLIGPGKPGLETPRGTFYVNRKVKDEISWEFGNAPMPYATYFTNNGIAFHEGDPSYLSHGCVRMYHGDAERYFNDLQIGDMVYVY